MHRCFIVKNVKKKPENVVRFSFLLAEKFKEITYNTFNKIFNY